LEAHYKELNKKYAFDIEALQRDLVAAVPAPMMTQEMDATQPTSTKKGKEKRKH
jgi:hypothetical protein